MGVSKNKGTPKCMIYNGKPLLKWMIWGENPLFSETPSLLIYPWIGFWTFQTYLFVRRYRSCIFLSRRRCWFLQPDPIAKKRLCGFHLGKDPKTGAICQKTKVVSQPSRIIYTDMLPSLKLTARTLKMDGWNISFLLGPGLFSGALLALRRVVTGVSYIPDILATGSLVPNI